MVQHENLPARLRENGLFCCWRYEERDGKKTKVPYNPRTGGRAQSTNPATFAPLDVALTALERGSYDGIGVGIFGNLGAIDIDHCMDDTGELSELAYDIMGAIQGYTERSPSGHGLRILFTVPAGFQYDKAQYYINNKSLGLEVYIAGATQKYVTVTGDVLTPFLDLEEREEQLLAVLKKHMVRPQAQTPTPRSAPAPLDWDAEIGGGTAGLDGLTLIQRAQRAKNGARFSALWSGDTTGYKSPSEADMALCGALAFWTNKDASQIDRLFRQSGLFRPDKWDRPTAGSTYGAITIQNAIATARQGYGPPPAKAEGLPVPFEPFEPPDTSKLPAFPIGQLPPALRDFTQAVAGNLQVAVDMPALQVLAVAALCLQGKFIVNPKPGWIEPLNLYAVTVARPSDRKSRHSAQLRAARAHGAQAAPVGGTHAGHFRRRAADAVGKELHGFLQRVDALLHAGYRSLVPRYFRIERRQPVELPPCLARIAVNLLLCLLYLSGCAAALLAHIARTAARSAFLLLRARLFRRTASVGRSRNSHGKQKHQGNDTEDTPHPAGLFSLHFAHEQHLRGKVVGIPVKVASGGECASRIAHAVALFVLQEIVVVDYGAEIVPAVLGSRGEVA